MPWKPVAGYEGFYEVSSDGCVRSLPRVVRHWKGGGSQRAGRELRAAPDKKGYLGVVLCREGTMKSVKVARLVAIAFIPNPEGLPQVNHRDGVKGNNKVENLEWTDNAGNQVHAWATGLQPPRQRETCPAGHPMDDAYIRPDGQGRMCRTCSRERESRRQRPTTRAGRQGGHGG